MTLLCSPFCLREQGGVVMFSFLCKEGKELCLPFVRGGKDKSRFEFSVKGVKATPFVLLLVKRGKATPS